MRFPSWTLVFALVTFAGCGGGSMCDRLDAAQNHMFNTGTCAFGITYPPAPGESGFQKSACVAKSSSCTSAETASILTYADCLQSVPSCQAGKELDFSRAVAACTQQLAVTTPDCTKALEGNPN